MKIILRLLLLVFCLTSLILLRGYTYVAPDAIDVRKLLPPPPADDSPAGRADLETVLQLQADRSPAQVARVVRVARQNIFTFASPVLGEWFSEQNLPRTAESFKPITDEGYAVSLQTKPYVTRPLPSLPVPPVQPGPNPS